jgi:hypothetical protein
MRSPNPAKKVSGSNPLRVLREQLGSRGKRLSTYKLSELIGVPGPTLRSIEAGKNAFTEGIRQRLRWRGASWDEKTKRWTFTYNASLPLTTDLLLSFRRLGRGSPFFQQLDARAICIQVITLLDAVPAADYLASVLRLRDFLQQLRSEYKVEGLDEFAAETKPKIEYRETRSGARFLHKEYSFKNSPDPDRVYDLCYLQKPTEWDEAEHAEPRVVTQPAAC